MSSKKINTPISEYKKCILKCLRQFWKSQNAEIWCSLYTFIKTYTSDERLKLLMEKEDDHDNREV